MNQESYEVKEYQQVDAFPAINFLSEPVPPMVHPKKFAEMIGLSEGVVGGWIDNGYIETAKVGKYRMINMVALESKLRGAA